MARLHAGAYHLGNTKFKTNPRLHPFKITFHENNLICESYFLFHVDHSEHFERILFRLLICSVIRPVILIKMKLCPSDCINDDCETIYTARCDFCYNCRNKNKKPKRAIFLAFVHFLYGNARERETERARNIPDNDVWTRMYSNLLNFSPR